MNTVARLLLNRPPNYDHDYDGRPSVCHGFDGDPLLAALMREHPELIPPKLIDQLATSRGRSF